MEARQIENWAFARSDAAVLVGMTSGQIGNYLTRYDLFPARPKGKGYHVDFKLADLLKLSAVKAAMKNGGLSAEEAAKALRRSRGPYHAMLTDGYGPDQVPLFNYPGTLFFSRNDDGEYVQFDSADALVSIQIRCWPLFDELWPRVRAQIEREGASDKPPYPGNVTEGIAAFETHIADLRALRWNGQRG
ncbi:MerR family transcriptional regulator [Methylobacterium sp. Leaf399]|uniref:MerR family transcriptional regulator n=1 Tax=Methylobacterium sp. Leaf399 TaxID=1736364 RepID=UPI000A5829E3|nr:MerR family transcriptional regulator [Methylobacterium sp. Leaf399]